MPSEPALAASRGVVFDLDGCVWNGSAVTPGARELIAALGGSGRGVAFLTNNSRATAGEIHARLRAARIEADPYRVLTPLEILGEVIRTRHGSSRVLVIGAPEMAAVVRAAGHEVLPPERYRTATVVAVGNDFDLTYTRLTAACRAVAAGAAFITPNVDPRLPVEEGEFLPGCGALVAAVAAAAGRQPEVVGKPEPPLFEIALTRLGVAGSDAVMVGDSVESDVRGGRAVGMRTVLYRPVGPVSPDADFTVRSFAELEALLLAS
jgi:HAD superfamily hydrolase (TIGR01450 family)